MVFGKTEISIFISKMKVNFFRYRFSLPKIAIILAAVFITICGTSHRSQLAVASNTQQVVYQTTQAFAEYKPQYFAALAHPSNYGDRYRQDIYGNVLNNQALAVLHETTNSARSAINTFRSPHGNNSSQVSYHALITLNGAIVYIVPSDKRAFGAGNSEFRSATGVETVQTNPNLASSVNNFAYHISLETPTDGYNNASSHSGYTENQYKSLAWLIALSNIADDRITTHQAVDRSGSRFDPRSFDFEYFFKILHSYRQQTTG